MKILNHMKENIFITGAGIAALSHSTWSLGTLFSGNMPVVAINDYGSMAMWVYWFVPAFLIAFALDIGQINTSHQIRVSGLTWQRGLTFIVFSFATYYLQFLYIAHHMPLLVVESGISAVHIEKVTQLRDAAIWLLPAILPLATFLYTLSGNTENQDSDLEQQDNYVDYDMSSINIISTDDYQDALPFADSEINLLPDAGHMAECDCGWQKDGYDSDLNARRALSMHQRSCEVQHAVIE